MILVISDFRRSATRHLLERLTKEMLRSSRENRSSFLGYHAPNPSKLPALSQ